jgi:ATP-dependent DNA helicase RecQ
MRHLHEYKILYVAPERLADEIFIRALKETRVSFFAIDEAHCISQWGHGFRPEYRRLSQLKEKFPSSAVMALTATATKEVQADIASQLAMREPLIVRASFDRPNLTFGVVWRDSSSSQLHQFLKKHPNQSGIIYASTRKGVDETYGALLQKGFQVGKYHAGLSDGERMLAQTQFLSGETLIIVATVAFGMGIHKSDIRFVVHIDMPRSLEQYYQEVGRAGRDGLPSSCFMMFSAQEKMIYQAFLEQIENEQLRRASKLKIDKMYTYCRTSHCRRKVLLQYFGEVYPRSNCGTCDNCLDEKEMIDQTVLGQKILSCVYRVGQRFGVQYVIDVLRGSKKDTIFKNGHHQLSTYRLTPECSEKELRACIESLIDKGFLHRSTGDYPVLKWSDTSLAVVKGEVKVLL